MFARAERLLDLVVERAGCLRFVEVKSRRRSDPIGMAVIDQRKQARLAAAANAFLTGYTAPVREACFLVAMVDRTHIDWLDHAFDA